MTDLFISIFVVAIICIGLYGIIAMSERKFEKMCHYTYRCPRCKNGTVVAQIYGAFSQFEKGKCETCDYEYNEVIC